MFACEHEGVVPDIVATAKALGGGLPLAGVTGRAEVMDAVHVGGLGGTYGGNPVACAAALAAIETIGADDLCARARHIEDVMVPRLRAAQQRHAAIGDVRGRGAMLAVEIVGPDKTPDAPRTAAVAKACHAEGVLVLTAGTAGNVLRFLPPLVIGDDLLADALDVLDKAFQGHPAREGFEVSLGSPPLEWCPQGGVAPPPRPAPRGAGNRVRVGEQPLVAVVDRPTGRVERPPRRLERDAVGVAEVDRAQEAVVDDVGDLAAVLLEPVLQTVQRILVGQVKAM